VIWSGSDEKQINLDSCNCLLEFVDDADLKKLFAQLILSHLKAKLLIDFPLNSSYYTINLSSVCMGLLGRVNFYPYRTLNTGVAYFCVKSVIRMDIS